LEIRINHLLRIFTPRKVQCKGKGNLLPRGRVLDSENFRLHHGWPSQLPSWALMIVKLARLYGWRRGPMSRGLAAAAAAAGRWWQLLPVTSLVDGVVIVAVRVQPNYSVFGGCIVPCVVDSDHNSSVSALRAEVSCVTPVKNDQIRIQNVDNR